MAALALIVGLGNGLACRPRASEVAEDPQRSLAIAAVEDGLVPWVQVAGDDAESWSLAERMAHYGVPGASVAVMRSGEIEWARGYGLREADLPPGEADLPGEVGPETLFGAGPVTAAALAIAVVGWADAEELDIDRDVNQLLTSVRVPVHPSGQKVTVRRLLNHVAGIEPARLDPIPATATLPEVADIIAGRPPAVTAGRPPAVDRPLMLGARPGLRYGFSETGLAVVQQVVVDVARADFSDWMAERLLRPVEMDHSRFSVAPPTDLAVARAHDAAGRVIAEPLRAPVLAVGGLWTTAGDLLRMVDALLLARDPARTGIVSARAASEILEPGLKSQALGFEIREQAGVRRLLASGGGLGYHALVTADLETGDGVAILTNGERGEMLAREIVLAVANAYGWRGLAPLMIDREVFERSAKVALVGDYRLDDGRLLHITLEGGGLILGAAPDVFVGEEASRSPIYPLAGSDWVIADRPERLRFEYQGGDLASALFLGEARAPRVGGDGAPVVSRY